MGLRFGRKIHQNQYLLFYEESERIATQYVVHGWWCHQTVAPQNIAFDDLLHFRPHYRENALSPGSVKERIPLHP